MDSLTYRYIAGTNKLDYISDAVNRTKYSEDIDNQSPGNYGYDAIGNLIKDNAEGISNIEWTVYGKIKKITKTDGSVIQYSYDAAGNRINKSVTAGGVTRQTFYVRDAQGNVLSVYRDKIDTLNAGKLSQTEVDIYGSSRLGMMRTGTNMEDLQVKNETALTELGSRGFDTSFTRGTKQYELTNHLGNVLVTVSDKKIGIRSAADTTTIDHYEADVITATDYYPFGMVMPGRSKYPSEIAEAKDVSTCTNCGMLQQLMSDYFSTQSLSVGSESAMLTYIQGKLAADSLSYTTTEILNAITACNNSWKKNIGFKANASSFLNYEGIAQVRFHKEDFSVGAWIYQQTANSNVQTIAMNNVFQFSGMAGYRLYMLNGRVYFQMGDIRYTLADSGCAQIRTVNTITPNQWHDVVAVRSGNIAANFKIYVDGVLQQTEVVDYPAMRGGDVYNQYSGRFVIGNGSSSGNNVNPFMGFIKNLKVYKRQITDAEAAGNYSSCTSTPVDTTGLVLWSKIDEGTSTAVIDYSNYHTNGALALNAFAGGAGQALPPSCVNSDSLVLCKTRTVTTKKVAGYRYGFNGKENDNEVKGEGNQLDYASRIYDPRVGRFLSLDPLQNKFPSLSPYLYALNNPIVMIDRDGEDAVVSITRNKDGGGVIKVQTVVHITGSTEDWRVKAYNSQAKKMYPDQSVNVEGKTWNIQYDIKYVYDKTFDASKMAEGENVLKIDPNTPMTGSKRTHVGPQTNQGLIAVGHRKYNEVIGHETGHLIGFNDQYTEINSDYGGFKDYLKNKYNTKEDLAPGGTLYKILKQGRSMDYSISIANEGYENNNMQNNKGGLTNAQNAALVNKVLDASNGKDGSFIIKGIFDAKGTPSKANLQKAFETLDAKIQEELKVDKPKN